VIAATATAATATPASRDGGRELRARDARSARRLSVDLRRGSAGCSLLVEEVVSALARRREVGVAAGLGQLGCRWV
jgi:hypothetical protein